MSWDNEFENLMIDLERMSQDNGKKIMASLQASEQRCYQSAKDDSEKFVSCMSKQVKTLKKRETAFEFQLVFLKSQAEKCFQKAGGEPLSVEDCKAKAKETLKKSFENFLSGL